jgi:hypothetical protein
MGRFWCYYQRLAERLQGKIATPAQTVLVCPGDWVIRYVWSENSMREWFAIGILWAATIGNAFAASYYGVELLVFALDDPAATEYLANDPGSPDFSAARTPAELGFSEKDPDAGNMGPEKYTLRTQADAEILYHGRWVQPMAHRTAPTPIRITAPAPVAGDPPLLDGVLKIGAGRFIHIDADLRMRGPRLTSPRASAPPAGSALAARPAENATPEYQFYRLTAHRKMSRNQLHYIDHPKMGILVRVTR